MKDDCYSIASDCSSTESDCKSTLSKGCSTFCVCWSTRIVFDEWASLELHSLCELLKLFDAESVLIVFELRRIFSVTCSLCKFVSSCRWDLLLIYYLLVLLIWASAVFPIICVSYFQEYSRIKCYSALPACLTVFIIHIQGGIFVTVCNSNKSHLILFNW